MSENHGSVLERRAAGQEHVLARSPRQSCVSTVHPSRRKPYSCATCADHGAVTPHGVRQNVGRKPSRPSWARALRVSPRSHSTSRSLWRTCTPQCNPIACPSRSIRAISSGWAAAREALGKKVARAPWLASRSSGFCCPRRIGTVVERESQSGHIHEVPAHGARAKPMHARGAAPNAWLRHSSGRACSGPSRGRPPPVRFAALGGSILLFLLFALAALALGGTGWIIGAVILAGPAGVGVYDVLQRRHSILRNYPIIGHARFAMEAVRAELQQYFVERNYDGRPYDSDTRTSIYERAKGLKDEQAYGTERDVAEPGYEWLLQSIHSIDPPKPRPGRSSPSKRAAAEPRRRQSAGSGRRARSCPGRRGPASAWGPAWRRRPGTGWRGSVATGCNRSPSSSRVRHWCSPPLGRGA
jgi:hypothetical protein